MSIFGYVRNLVLLGALVFAIVNPCTGKSAFTEKGWDELPELELEATTPRVTPEVSVEFLYREVKVIDLSYRPTSFDHHNRLKIFSDSGVEDFSKIDIPFVTGQTVSRKKARIIYPDGTIAHLTKKDFYKREIFKDGKFKSYAWSFSYPGLKKGCIIEYKYRLTLRYWLPSLNYDVLDKFPTWKLLFDMTPDSNLVSYVSWYRGHFKLERKGRRFILDINNLPARSNKSYIPARKDFEPWIHLLYADAKKYFKRDKYWGYRGGDLVEVNKRYIKHQLKDVKALAKKLFSGLSTQEAKLKAAYEYCANEIENISYFTTKYTEEEIEELKDNLSPKQTLKRGYGTSFDINSLFASLARAAGYNVSLAQIENQDELRYDPNILSAYNLSDGVVAVDQGKDAGWAYYDPGSSYLPLGVLNPENAGSVAMVIIGKYYKIQKTPKVSDNFTKTERVANVNINEIGDVEGNVIIKYSGYASLWRKRLFAGKTEEECKDYILEHEWKNRIPRVTIKDVTIVDHDNRSDSLTISFQIVIPGYADSLGNRFIINPNLFEKGRVPIFQDEKRWERVAFPYSELVFDKIYYKLPGYHDLEGESKKPTEIVGPLLARQSINQMNSSNQTMIHQRIYRLKKPKINSLSYEWVKNQFNEVDLADTREVILIRKEKDIDADSTDE